MGFVRREKKCALEEKTKMYFLNKNSKVSGLRKQILSADQVIDNGTLSNNAGFVVNRRVIFFNIS